MAVVTEQFIVGRPFRQQDSSKQSRRRSGPPATGVCRSAFRRPASPLVHVGGVDRSGRTCVSNTDLLSSDAAKAAAAASSDPGSSNGTRKRAGLSGMVLAELRALAGELGLSGTAGMRKGDLIAAIKERQAAGSGRANGRTTPAKGGQTELPVTAAEPARTEAREGRDTRESRTDNQDVRETTREGDDGNFSRNRRRRSASRPAGSP